MHRKTFLSICVVRAPHQLSGVGPRERMAQAQQGGVLRRRVG